MSDLKSHLKKKAYDFDFFQAITLLEEYFRKKDNVTELLNSGRIQFSSDTSISFPPSDISSVQENEDGSIRFFLSFMGLLGISSPLPQYFIEQGLRRDEDDKSALVDFLNIFEHRLYVLFYQAWKKYRLINMLSSRDPFKLFEKIALLGGLTSERLQKWQRMVGYSGIMAVSCRSAEGLRTILSSYFNNIPVNIVPWIPRWAEVRDLKQIGSDSVLGVNAMIGTHIRDVGGKFRVVLGPLKKVTFQTFLPDSKNIDQLQEIVSNYLTDPLEFDIEVKLKPSDLTPVILGGNDAKLGIISSCGRSSEKLEAYSIIIEQ
ncbi:MAG: type VI secretion system baseplate subunit TssG [Chitinispirillia bacterium]